MHIAHPKGPSMIFLILSRCPVFYNSIDRAGSTIRCDRPYFLYTFYSSVRHETTHQPRQNLELFLIYEKSPMEQITRNRKYALNIWYEKPVVS